MRNRVISFCFLILFIWACNQVPNQQGERLYTMYCANCHGANGEGLGELYPPLAGSDFWQDSADLTPCMIINGRVTPVVVNGKTYDGVMAKIEMKETAIANVMNYIENRWYGGKRFWAPEAIVKLSSPEVCR